MRSKKFELDERIINSIITELNEIENLTSDQAIKYRINNLASMLIKITNEDGTEPIKDIIYKKMKEAVKRNPELNVKLYVLYRSLSEGKISEKEAKEMYENYLHMYPYDTLIY